jgi:LemA protein
MELTGFIILALLAAAFFYGVMIYNALVSLKHNIDKAWSNIDVLLKQRHDELPKLVEVCKQYMKFEQETLEKVIQARSQVFSARESGNIGALGAAEGMLRMGLGNLFALAENYPELKADQTFKHLQTRITSLENQIADRREFYNESVNVNNVRIEQFPDIIVARLLGFKAGALLQFSVEEKADVNIKALFG